MAPHRITNNKLYQVTRATINNGNWKKMETAGAFTKTTSRLPSKESYEIYFDIKTNKKFVGRKRATIVSTIYEDIERTKEKHTDFPITPLISLVSLQSIHTKAKNRGLWQKVVSQVVDLANSLKSKTKYIS